MGLECFGSESILGTEDRWFSVDIGDVVEDFVGAGDVLVDPEFGGVLEEEDLGVQEKAGDEHEVEDSVLPGIHVVDYEC